MPRARGIHLRIVVVGIGASRAARLSGAARRRARAVGARHAQRASLRVLVVAAVIMTVAVTVAVAVAAVRVSNVRWRRRQTAVNGLHAALARVSLCYAVGNARHASRGHLAEVVRAGRHVILGVSTGVGVCSGLLRIPVIVTIIAAGKVAGVALVVLRRRRRLAVAVVVVFVAVVLVLVLVLGHWRRRRLAVVVRLKLRRDTIVVGSLGRIRRAGRSVIVVERLSLRREAVLTVALHGWPSSGGLKTQLKFASTRWARCFRDVNDELQLRVRNRCRKVSALRLTQRGWVEVKSI